MGKEQTVFVNYGPDVNGLWKRYTIRGEIAPLITDNGVGVVRSLPPLVE